MVVSFLLFVPGSWLSDLHKDLRFTQRHAFAPGTVKNLKSQWKKFFHFCHMLGQYSFPVSEDTLCLYIQFLSRSLKSPASIRNYVSGLKCLHDMLGYSFPGYQSLPVKLTFKGLDKLTKHVPHQAHPITVSLLRRIHGLLDFTDQVHVVVWCLFLFCFLSFSRKSQFIPANVGHQEVSRLVTRQDIVSCNKMLWVMFRWTKTRQVGGAPLSIPLAPIPGSPLCPVSAFKHMVEVVPASPESPAFVIPSASGLKPIVYSVFHNILRGCISSLGLEAGQFSSHSFRRGGATFAFECGLPAECIKSQGDWRSDAYQLYIDISQNQRVMVAKTLSRAMSYNSC